MKKKISILLVIILLVSAAILRNSRKQKIDNAPLPTPLTNHIKIIRAKNGNLEQTRSYLGQLQAQDIATTSSKLSGVVTKILVTENQLVQKNELLLKIDSRETIANIKALEATVTAQNKEVEYNASLHKRNIALYKVGGLSREKFEASEVAYTSKQAMLETSAQKVVSTKAQLSYLDIKAPFTGRVGSILTNIGDLASPGKPLITVNSLKQKVIFSFAPNDVSIKIGQQAYINGKKIGAITSYFSDAKNGLAQAELAMDQPLLLPNNSYLNFDLLVFSGSGCLVPLNSLIQNKYGQTIMIYKDQQFSPMAVQVTANNDNHAIISPCPSHEVAVTTEAKLGQLPSFGKIAVSRGESHE